MEYNTPQEVSERQVIFYPYEGGIDECAIPYGISESTNQTENSKLEKTVLD